MDTQDIGNSIARTVNEIVKGVVEHLTDEVKSGNIIDACGLDETACEMVDSHDWVIYTYKASLIATEVDWSEARDALGVDTVTPELLSFFHLIEEVRGSEGYQDLFEKLEEAE